MNLCQKIKNQTILIPSSNKSRSKITKIYNQPTLIATMLSLKQEEKAIVAVVRIKDPLIGDQLIPFGFKCHRDLIPCDIKPACLSSKNTVSIAVEGIKPLKAMIVGYGDDSKEVSEAYKIFCEKSKDINAQKKINIWLSSSLIYFTQISVSSLEKIQRSEFEHFVKVADSQKKGKFPKTSTPLKKPQEIVQIDLADEKDQDSNQGKHLQTAGSSKQVMVKVEEDEHVKPSIQHVKEVVKEIQEIAGYSITQASVKAFHAKVARTFDVLYSYLESRDDSPKSKFKLRISERPDNYFIPTYDRTYESGNFTYIEGLLPVPTKKYKRAMNNIPSKIEELEPTLIISAIVKFAFPNHWITDVTLRGAGGRKSLITIWNHQNPIANPAEGAFENGLGVSRLRALLDHAVRMCGKLSYDLLVEKALHTSIAKAMHYVRTQLLIKTSGRDSSEQDSSYLTEEMDFEIDPADYMSQESNDPDDNIRVTRKKSRESQSHNNLDKFPEDNDSQSSQSNLFGESSGKMASESDKKSKKLESPKKGDKSDIDSTENSNQNTTEPDSGFGQDKDFSETQSMSGSFSQKRQYSGIASINKRIKSSVDTLRAIQEPDILPNSPSQTNEEIPEPQSVGDENETKVGPLKEMRVVLSDKGSNAADSDHPQDDFEVESETGNGSGAGSDDEKGSVRDSEVGSNMNENIQDKDSNFQNEKPLNDEETDESNQIPLTQALNEINSNEDDSTQDQDGEPKDQKEIDLENLFASDPRAALLFIKNSNLVDTFISKFRQSEG
ncbi:uncharacterized protein LOC112539174 [Tetranychus urticae]|uniref:uncharacterized protein LOC112539174 n=1 Tax=Tetranychus urticae TaxID=32264 RepID=UPI000D64F063|nr:uncharacterized protein LOC112539174 [Tetranychus urticae]